MFSEIEAFKLQEGDVLHDNYEVSQVILRRAIAVVFSSSPEGDEKVDIFRKGDLVVFS